MTSLLERTRFVLFRGVAVCMAVLVLTGCSGGSESPEVDKGQFVGEFLPTKQTITSHPDSLTDVKIVETESGRLDVELQESYKTILRTWSVRPQTPNGRSPWSRRSYATLWSRDLSIIALKRNTDLSALPVEEARKKLDQNRETYRESVQFYIRWYTGYEPVDIRAFLHDGEGNSYEAKDISLNRSGFAVLSGGETDQFFESVYTFERIVDGKDVLANLDELRLEVNFPGAFKFWFDWKAKQDLRLTTTEP